MKLAQPDRTAVNTQTTEAMEGVPGLQQQQKVSRIFLWELKNENVRYCFTKENKNFDASGLDD